MLLSVIIPTYNRVTFLNKMLQSVISQIQTYGLHNEVELVVSDNCSSDGTENFMKELVRSLPDVNLRYNRNEVNIGAVRNILKLVQLAGGKYCMFYGDDDAMGDGALPQIIGTFRQHPEKAVFVFKQKNYPEIRATEELTIHQCASRYFYYMGNACSAWHTGFAQKNIERFGESLVSTCWPQTHMMYLGMYDARIEKPVLVSTVEAYKEQVKDNNNIPNSYYIYESQFYALIKLGRLIAEQTKDAGFYKAIRNGVVAMRRENFFAFCRYVIHTNKAYCTAKEKAEFRGTLAESFKNIKGAYKAYVLPIAIMNLVPAKLYLWLYLNGKAIYTYTKRRSERSLRGVFQEAKQRLTHLQEERFRNMQKKHAIIVNKGEW